MEIVLRNPMSRSRSCAATTIDIDFFSLPNNRFFHMEEISLFSVSDWLSYWRRHIDYIRRCNDNNEKRQQSLLVETLIQRWQAQATKVVITFHYRTETLCDFVCTNFSVNSERMLMKKERKSHRKKYKKLSRLLLTHESPLIFGWASVGGKKISLYLLISCSLLR